MDKVIDKLKKLLALAERGERGEAYNARKILERELSLHGLTIEDLRSENLKERVFAYKTKDEATLFYQILSAVCGEKSEAIKDARYNSRKKRLYVCLTDMQYIDVVNMWIFHRRQFNKERNRILKDILSAYVNKHDIFDPEASPSDPKSVDWDEIARILKLSGAMEDVTYHKLLK
jgi:hypothetical protein